MFILDTNVISELRKAGNGRADPHVTAWAGAQPVTSLFVSAISILEIETGILQIERRDEKQGATLRRWMDQQVLPAFAERILPVTAEVALQCARLHVPDPRSDRDALIAATAMVSGMTVATRNIADFEPTGVKLCNPWDAQT
jgi:predicted nucleic acid-binding protein